MASSSFPSTTMLAQQMHPIEMFDDDLLFVVVNLLGNLVALEGYFVYLLVGHDAYFIDLFLELVLASELKVYKSVEVCPGVVHKPICN